MDARTFPMHQSGRRLSTQSGPRACTQLGVDAHPLSKAELGLARNSLFFFSAHRSSTSRGLGVPVLGLMSRRAIIFSPHTPGLYQGNAVAIVAIYLGLSTSAPRQPFAGDMGVNHLSALDLRRLPRIGNL